MSRVRRSRAEIISGGNPTPQGAVEAAPAFAAPSRRPPRGPLPAVLCVDDERPVLDALMRLLRREPFDLITTNDPQAALEWVRRHRVDLVVADERMPEMSGSELLRVVRRWSPVTAVVLMTGYGELPEGGGDPPDHPVIHKPWNDDEFAALIRRLAIGARPPPAGPGEDV